MIQSSQIVSNAYEVITTSGHNIVPKEVATFSEILTTYQRDGMRENQPKSYLENLEG